MLPSQGLGGPVIYSLTGVYLNGLLRGIIQDDGVISCQNEDLGLTPPLLQCLSVAWHCHAHSMSPVLTGTGPELLL